MTKRVCIYSRVSKESGDYQRQVNELTEYAHEKGYEIVDVISEKISGGVKNEERPGLVSMMNLVRQQKVDKVLVWEASRISRVSLEAAKIISELNEYKVSLFIKNYNLETLDEKGNIDPMAKFMLAILNEFSENERLNIKMRLKSGYDKHRSQGGIVGRKSGTSESQEKFLEKHNDAIKLLKKGISIRNVSQLTGKSTKTIQKIRNAIG